MENKNFYNLHPRQNISGGLAFVLVGLLSVLLSWYVTDKSEQIIDDVSDSSIVRIDQRNSQDQKKKELKYENVDSKFRTQNTRY